MGTPPLEGSAELVADATGVGAAVVDMLRDAGLRFVSVIITAGEEEVRGGGIYRVPKRDLIAATQLLLLQCRKLRIAAALPEAETFAAELRNFRYEVTRAGRDTYAAWREGDHADLVLAVALAVWAAQKAQPPAPAYPNPRVGAGSDFSLRRELPSPPLKGRIFKLRTSL